MRWILAAAALTLVALAAADGQAQVNKASGGSPGKARVGGKAGAPKPYLFVWVGDADRKDSDFLAVVDARPSEPTYGRVIATLPVGNRATMPHHTEYEFPPGRLLFANGWAAGRTFLIDLRNPMKPRLVGQFTRVAGYGYPHSFVRLPNGHVLATFQARGAGYDPPGALVELDQRGRVVRSSSAAVSGMDDTLIWPYSLAVSPAEDRVVTTSSQMGLPGWASAHGSDMNHDEYETRHVQVWSLHDLRLLATVPLPAPPRGEQNLYPAEPRVLPDGTFYVNTFNCGLYRLTGVEGPDPKAEYVYSFPGGDREGTYCAVPVVYGRFWVQTVPALPGLIALDVSDPARPVEVSRLVFDKRFVRTHWVAADRGGGRLVVTGADQSWVLMVKVDGATGRLTLDEKFRGESAAYPGLDFDRLEWPHGATGGAIVHGALFGP